MEDKNRSFKTDIAFLLLLALSFAGILFFAFDKSHIVENGILLCGATAVFMISYFTNIKFGLTATAAVLFLLLVYTVLNCTLKGAEIPIYVFFWILWLPLITAMLSMFLQHAIKLRNENRTLTRRLESNEMKNETTGLKNQRFYQNDALRAMKLSVRLRIPLSLVLWSINNEDELKTKDDQEITKIITHISDVLTESIGEGDECYILSQTPYLWGALIFRSAQEADKIAESVQQKISNELNERRSMRNLNTSVTTDCGVYGYTGEDQSAFELLQNAKKTMVSVKSEALSKQDIKGQSFPD